MTKTGPRLTVRAPVGIAILCYDGAQATCIHGLTDLFMYADYFARMHAAASSPATPRPADAKDQPFLSITHLHVRKDGWVDFAGNPGAAQAAESAAVVIVPACQLGPPEPGHSPRLAEWVAHCHARGAVVASVCGGVFLLAESGLLDGRRVTTHWQFAPELRSRHPRLHVDADRLVIDDCDIVTAGGVLAWADLGLTLVERLLGRTVMCSTARFMLVDPAGREQRFYGDFMPPLHHGDGTIVAIQHWLQKSPLPARSVAALARRAGLGSRTFLRRFSRATGMTPGEYQQRLRIARSRELLEFSRDTVERVAAVAGYGDVRGFRRSFKRMVGLSPAEYRRRFQRPGMQ